ncbi:uncharacterized protein SCODWIG_00444 [Saccharomycodes ludwigii]|uniref:Non-classical export protein 1 n=1 Tax=Saccharomycodes ludwigii TaxID=36035 RepID=A0A376B1Z7_9ASCO|nr:hypothetical protein SCDLUD_004048 [Saccharomycodes ludwigii]KAH3899760.1 hypothetical protein SCDLUD_004048 [Saccharomycodes ludwigii]SSD58683.1 uncharacterized protein SCODWIG_00444 [Saccharomycodes ludwigii]
MVQPAPYLLGRFLDPIFAIGVGTLSYIQYERNTHREPGHTLYDLLQKKFFATKEQTQEKK